MLGVETTRRLEAMLLAALVLVLVWMPVPLASNRPWAVSLLALALWAVLLGACLLRCLGAPLPVPAPSSKMSQLQLHTVAAARTRRRLFGPQAWPVLLLVLLNGWIALQSLSPWGHTEDRFASQVYLLRSLCCLAAFGCVLLLANTTDRRRWLLLGVFVAGILQAVVAVVLFSSGASYEYLGTDFQQGTRAMGTFANFDHLANYMALTLAAGIGAMLGQMGASEGDAATATAMPKGWRRALHGTMSFMLSPKMLIRMMLVLLVITLVLTRSRMGNGAFFMALPVLAVVLGGRSRQLRKPALWLVASLLVVDIVVVGQWVGLEKVVARIEATELSKAEALAKAGDAAAQGRYQHREETLEERLHAADDALHMVQQKPWTGWGAGSFYAAFPAFKRAGLGLYDHTHNDYIEIAADIGLVGLALLVAVFLLTAGRVWRMLSDDNSAQERGLAAGVGVAMLCALLHGFVDFTLQIPANSVSLTLLLAMVWAAPSVGLKKKVQGKS